MNNTLKIGDFVCEIGNPKIKMTIIAIDKEKSTATCEWIKDRKSKEKEHKDFRLDELTLAINYGPKRF